MAVVRAAGSEFLVVTDEQRLHVMSLEGVPLQALEARGAVALHGVCSDASGSTLHVVDERAGAVRLLVWQGGGWVGALDRAGGFRKWIG